MPWVRNMVKYGDFFLHLDINEKYGITNVVPLSPYEVVVLREKMKKILTTLNFI